METLSYRTILRFVKMLNVVAVAFPIGFVWRYQYAVIIGIENDPKMTGLIMILFMALYITYGRIYGGFYVSSVRISEMIYSQSLALLISDGLFYGIAALISQSVITIVPICMALSVQAVLIVCWCLGAHIWYFRTFPPKKTAIVYDHGENIDGLIEAYGLRKKYDVQKIITVAQWKEHGFQELKDVNTVFLCGTHSSDRNIILKYCVEHEITSYILPRIGDIILSGAKRLTLFHLPFLRVERYSPGLEYLCVKRGMDIVISAAALVFLSPVMLATALAIKLTDGGTVFYKQKRLTKNGKIFQILKFRSMRTDAEKDGVARLSTGDRDDRVTSIGRIIRKIRVDELPQLINILAGDMSLVGPRPERPELAEQYKTELPEFALRLQAKAGLTGYAQVYGKYNTTPYNKLQMDLMYIAHPSIFEDIRILFATIKILFLPESTEGVEAGMETAMKKTEERKPTIDEI